MPQIMTGRFVDGPNKGRLWQVYRDDRSPTGWVRKIWDPYDPNRTEYFENFNAAAADVDEATAQGAREDAAAQAARAKTAADDADAARAAAINSATQYRDVRDQVGDRQWQATHDESVAARVDKMAQLREAVAEQAREHADTYGLDRDKLGLDILKTGASLRGADDLVQGWAFSQGVNNAGLSPYVAAIRGGTTMPYGGGTAVAGNPAPATLGSLAAGMGAGSTGTDAYGRPILPADKQSFVDSVSQRYQQGLANLPLGYFENMPKAMKQGFQSAGAWLGRDVDTEDEYYRRSRPSQGSALRG